MRLLPVLKPADWNGPALGARAHGWLGSVDEPVAWVAYAWDSPEGLVYATAPPDDRSDGSVDVGRVGGAGRETALGDELVSRAYANLDEVESVPEVVEADGSRLLVMGGSEHAAELVLSARHRAIVHDALDTDDVMVSVARRGVLVACPATGSPRARATIAALHREAWSTAGPDRITDALVRVSDDGVVAAVEVAEDGTVPAWT